MPPVLNQQPKLRILVSVLFVLAGPWGLLTGCTPASGSPADAGTSADAGAPADAGPKASCVGGFIEADGGCVGKCDPTRCVANNTCVGNACVLKCSSHLQCFPYTQRCVAAVEDDTDAGIFICADTDLKGVGVPCPSGTECGTTRRCRSSGQGDATAYCTANCVAASDCPGGFECGYLRDPHQICGTTKGNNNACGTTSEPCFDRARLATEPWFVEGTICLERKMCLKREACAPCSNDIDCSLAEQHCVQMSDGNRCASSCATDRDCGSDKHCVAGFCHPRSPACTGSTFCSPCRFDLDCEPTFECVSLHGTEKACIDLKFTHTCTTSADCPASPAGLQGTCLDEQQGVHPGDNVYHRCYAPRDPVTDAFTCYPSN